MKTQNQNKKSRFIQLFAALILGLVSFSTAQAQLYFSEYAEGSSYNKCVEIYHCGDATLDLTDWEYHSYQNGSTTAGYIIALDGIQSSLAPGEILVICNPGAVTNSSLTISNVDLFSNSIQFNGNDAVALYNAATGTYSDIFGDASSTSNFAKDDTWRRSCDVVTANTFPGSNSTTNWDNSPAKDDLSGFGTFSGCESCPMADGGEGCEFVRGDESCPMITGYLEGTGFNKCIEITNPTCDTICLSNIRYKAFHNGADSANPTYQRTLGDFKDFLLPGETFVICHPDADSVTLLVADTTWTGIQHNGDDALALWNINTGSYCDIFGTIGEDPGTQWIDTCGPGDTLRTANTNLQRQDNLCSGDAVTSNPAGGFPTLCTQWVQDLDTNTTAGFGTQDVSFCLVLGGCASPKNLEEDAAEIQMGNLNVYPNPTAESAAFEFTVSSDQNVTLEVFTLTGVKVAQPYNGMVKEGVVIRANFDASVLPSGTYIYRLNAGAESQSGNITVLR